jgi:hypothetical protein
MPTPNRPTDGPRSITRTAALLIVILLLLAIVPASTLAAGPSNGSGSGNGKGQGGPNRDVDVDVQPKRARIQSTVQGSGGGSDGGDCLDYEIQVGNMLTLQMQYRNEAEAKNADVEMTVRFGRMLEYEDLDDDGKLGHGDEIVSTYDLEKTNWGDLVHADETGEDGKKVHTITASTSDGVFAMVSHTTETKTQTQHGELSPNMMKIDLIVDGYTWTRTTTRLALQASVQTEGTITHISDPAKRQYMDEGEAGIETEEGSDTGFYTWVRSADVDGSASQVRTRVTNDGEGTTLTFNYAQGDSIVHDPKLGVPLVDEGLFDVMERLVPYLAVIGLSAVVIGIAVYYRRRTD